MHARSASGAPGVGSVCLATGSDSPVSVDSSTSTLDACNSRASAGITSSARTSMMSPGRSRAAGTFSRRCSSRGPKRRRAGGSWTASSRFRVRSACSCCSADKAALTRRTLPTRTASSAEPSRALATAPVASIGVIGSDRSPRISSAKSRTAPHDATAALCNARTGGTFRHHTGSSSRYSSRGRGSSRCTSATGRACQSWAVSGSGSGSRRILRAARYPNHRLATMPTLTDAELRPGTPGTNINAPIAEAEAASRTALSVAARAAGSACRTRQAPVRSDTNTSAPHGGGRRSRSTPIVMSDRCAARISDVVNNATVAPPAFNSATAAANAWSIDPSGGYS